MVDIEPFGERLDRSFPSGGSVDACRGSATLVHGAVETHPLGCKICVGLVEGHGEVAG